MCLIKGKEAVNCAHMTCKRFELNPQLHELTIRSRYLNRDDFNKIKLSRTHENEPNFIKVSNPHNRKSPTWESFEVFRKAITGIKAMGVWPKDTLFIKSDIDFQFFYYGRRIGDFDPLSQEYIFRIEVDVDEGAVYCGPKVPIELSEVGNSILTEISLMSTI